MPSQAPTKIKPKALDDYLEVMTKAVFQSGMSWSVIEAKWDGFQEAFEGFDPAKVAAFTPEDSERLEDRPPIGTRYWRARRAPRATSRVRIDHVKERESELLCDAGLVEHPSVHGRRQAIRQLLERDVAGLE